MAEDSGALESFYDFSIVQPDDHEYGEADIRLAGSSNDLSSLQNVSASTTRGTEGKGRLDSLKENLYKQQERLTALKERALRKSQDGRHKSSMSDSMESLKTLGQKLTVLKTRSGDSSTPLVSPTKESDPGDVSILQTSGSEKLLMLTQRTEQNRALLEQRKRDLAKSLLSVKSNIGHETTAELGSSMTDLRHTASASNPPVSRHRSALDLEAQGQEPVDESRVKLLRSRMKLTELRQGRQEQELHELRTELAKRAELIERLELSGAELQRTLTQRNEELEQLRVVQAGEDSLKVQENSRLQGEVLVLRERLTELENVNDLLETTRCELQEELTTARERQRNLELEQEQEKASRSPQSEAASTDAQVSAELAKQLQELTNQLADLQATNEELRQQVAVQAKLQVTDEIVSQRLEELEATIAAQLLELQEQKSAMAAQNEELAEKTTELNVLNVNLRLLEEKLAQSSRSKPLFLEDHSEDSAASKQMQEDLQQLKQKLDETNKANIKLKLKCKQAEKKLQKFQSQDGQQQLASLLADNEELQQRIAVLEDEKGQWQLANMQEDDRQPEQSTESNPLQLETIRLLEEQKLELQQALEALLSSSSSAESIEIVERHHLECLGQRRPASEGDAQEQKQVHPPGPSHVSELTQTEHTEEEDSSGETLSQLRERLELFTQERGEVLDKLEQLSAENLQLQARLEESSSSLQLLQREREKDLISSTSTSSNLSQELSSMQRSSEVVATLDAGEGGPVLFEKCEKSLSKLNSELEAYRKANDRQAKFNVSKKLAKEAKNCHTQLSELLHKVKEASTAVETVTVVETVVAVTAPNGKALAEYEQLNAQNAELKAVISRLRQELDELRESYPETEAPLAIVGSDAQKEDEILQLQSQLEDARSVQAEQRQQIEEQLDQIRELRQTEAEQVQLVARQSAEITQLQLQSEQFDQLLNSKEMSHEKQLEQQTRIRRELEARAESLEGELSILQTLVAEQKQQLIESVSESEHALNLKMLELQSAQEELRELRAKEDPDQLREAPAPNPGSIKGLEQAHKEEQFKNRELREKLKKYALNLKKRTQDNADLEQKVQELTSQLQEQQELVKQKEEVEREPIVDNHRVEQLQQQVSKLNEDLKAKIHVNLENRDALRQLKQQIQEQEQLIQVRDAELQDANLVSKELRRERQEADQEVFQLGQENSRLREEISKLQEDIRNLGQRVNEEPTAVEELRRQLEAKSKKFEKSKELIKLRNATIQSLQRELQQLQQDQDSEVDHVRNTRAAQEQLRLEKDAEITALRQEILKLENQKSRTAGEGDDTITKTSHQLLESQSQQQAESLQVAERELQQLRVQLTAAQEQHSLLAQQYASDKANFEMTIARLETLHEGIQAKLQEDASYIESLEAQNTELQTRSAALEEQAANQANHQAASQDKVQILEQQLQEQREQEEQQRQQDQQLQERLYELGQREQAQSRQLELLTSEAEESRQHLAGLRADYESLLAKHSQLTATAQAEREQMSSHSQEELAELRQQLDVKEADLHRQRQVYDAKLAAKATELDELECDLNSHVERAAAETRDLCQQLERSQELVNQQTEELQRLNEEFQEVERERSTLSREVTLLRLQHDSAEQDVLELQELRMQAMQDKTEMDNLRTQIDALCANHSQELQALQQRIAELDTLGQNQTDDQVYIETENKRLAEQLSELQAQLARQQQQQHHHPAVQSQQHPPPASLFFGGDALAAPSPFDEIAQPLRVSSLAASAPPPISPPPTIEDLQRNVSDLEKHAQDLETKLLARNQNLAEQEERRLQLEQRLSEVERLLSERTQQLADIQTANEERDRLAALEKLIQPRQRLHWTCSLASHLDLGLPQTEPVVEPLIQPKKAYLCQPKQEIQEQTAQTIDWGVDEDPWASAANEAPQTDVEHLHTRIAQLELQLSNAEQQKTELQTIAAKLMKRLKEYKTKATTTATPTVTVDNDLDSTIIEELKHQLQLQESRLSKAEEISQQHALEKEKLAKRIDVLTAGNDRMAEMKERQDMDVQMYQARIRELQEKLSQLDQWGEPAATVSSSLDGDEAARIESLQQEIQQLRQQLIEMEDERTRDQAELEALRQSSQGYDEAEVNQKLELQQLRQQVSELEALRTRDQAELEALRQSSQGHDEAARIAIEQQDNQQLELQQLRQEIVELETLRTRDQTELEALRQSSQGHDEAARIAIEQQDNQQLELQQLRQQLIELEALRARDQTELEALRKSCQGQQLSVDMASGNDEQMAQLQEKESEIVHLKQRIEELMREDQTEKLVFEILTKNQELQLLRMQVKQLEEDKEDQQVSAAPPKDDGETVEKLKSLCQQLQQEKSDMEEELRVLNNHVLSSLELEDRMKQTLLQLDTKNIEITELRRSLEILQSQNLGQSPAAQQIPDLSAINQQWEQLVEQKCGEVARIWQEHLSQREAAFKAQLDEVTQQQQRELPQSQQSTQGEATSDIMQKMQKALETQEMEIVTLKEQLAIRSAEYARLAAQYDPFRLQNRGGASGGNPASTTVSAGGPPSLTANEPLPEYVLKADLDYALMMLHQRDMRVEEMIVELVQLLEERDHLQLKLSDTLRQLETERSRVSDEPSATASSSAASSSSPSKISSAGSNSELLGTTSAAGSDLKQKLAELQTVKHSKDKVIVDEREQRLQQMLQLQKDMAKQGSGSQSGAGAGVVAATAPTSAAPTAIGVDLSQSGLRSPSMMLMDWILGNNNKEEEAGHQATG
ncbi:GD16316 [Drosophila simulans]|uniref:GD16316 n=1 Tax=Drosophila simulans TaxID=7240 RepID=B4R489_DROSI|nr:GD16316 [Drosophila simulans]